MRVPSATLNFSLKMEGTCVSGQRIFWASGRLGRIAVFAAAGTLGLVPEAEAAIYYWRDTTSAITQPVPKAQAKHSKAHRRGDKKSDIVENESAKPQGPVIISISIAQQKLRIYDAHGLFAETPVSTGMPGHPTPMGVFSIIQKHKFHHSNIYSGAPMPYMQRITWSGVAMHAGVLPGHPASHGCIRMPMAFAMKMWNWTKMGARVIVTPGDVVPASFSHPLLASVKAVPQPVAAEETKADVIAVRKVDKPAEPQASAAPAAPEPNLELRSTVGHADDTKSATPPRVQTADASGAVSANQASDAAPAPELKEADAAKPEAQPDSAKHDETASSDEPSAEARSAGAADNEAKPVEAAGDQPARPGAVTAANDATKPDEQAAVATVSAASTETPKAETEANNEKPADAAAAAAPAPVTPAVATNETPLKGDLKSDFAKAASSAGPGFTLKNNGQIAVFVSRKDSKLYIRQNFSPLFDVPVKIATDERPLGTHIFTAQVDNGDANVLHWSVVSLPVPAKSADRRAEDERASRSRKNANAAPAETKPHPAPDTPAEALDRLNLPAVVMAKIYEAVSTGGSIIVSDQGIAAGETGEGTDFIVSLR
jgi:lipoprotein-anchoring transpeptidase ErfK/SrfK